MPAFLRNVDVNGLLFLAAGSWVAAVYVSCREGVNVNDIPSRTSLYPTSS